MHMQHRCIIVLSFGLDFWHLRSSMGSQNIAPVNNLWFRNRPLNCRTQLSFPYSLTISLDRNAINIKQFRRKLFFSASPPSECLSLVLTIQHKLICSAWVFKLSVETHTPAWLVGQVDNDSHTSRTLNFYVQLSRLLLCRLFEISV